MRSLLFLPEGTAPEGGWPGILAIHDIFGFTNDIRRIGRRFADSGHAALIPALDYGAGAPFRCVVRTMRDLQRRSGPAFARMEAARATLAEQPEINGGRLGVTGFCMGGGFAIFFAARGRLQVCAPFYGDTPEEPEGLRDVCPVVASFGELDKPFLEHGRRLARNLEQLGIAHDVKIYAGVGHAFMNDHGGGPLAALGRHTPMHAGYDEQASEDAWRRMLAFFGEHL